MDASLPDRPDWKRQSKKSIEVAVQLNVSHCTLSMLAFLCAYQKRRVSDQSVHNVVLLSGVGAAASSLKTSGSDSSGMLRKKHIYILEG